jgi:hypothetical protein
MLTAVVKSAFRACEPDDYDPLAVTERVRAGIAPFGFERFVTLVVARVSAVASGDQLLLSTDGVLDAL